MRKFVVFFALIVFVTGASARVVESDGFEYQLVPTPQWVEPVAIKQPKFSSDESVQYLLSDSQRKISKDSEESFFRLIAVARSRSGITSVSKIYISFNPNYQALSLHSISVTRDGFEQNRLNSTDISLLRREERLDQKDLIDGRVTAVVLLDDIRVGDQIEYAYSISGVNPVLGNKHFSSLQLGWSSSLGQLNIRILIDKDRVLGHKIFQVPLEVTEHELGDWREYRVETFDVKPVFNEDEYPSWYTPYPWVEFSEFSGWGGVNEWALSLYQPALDADVNIVDKEVKSLISNISNIDDQIIALIRYVQDEVRYLGIVLGDSSHRPSLPGEVLQRRYGDCKDKTVLLISMLKRLGVDAAPALVASGFGSVLDESLPASGQFDHVIVTFDWAGRRYWVDPTISYQRGDIHNLSNVYYGKALIVRSGEKDLTDMAPDRTYFSSMDIKENYYTVDYFSRVEYVITATYEGKHADYQRHQFASYSMNELKRRYQNFYEKIFSSVEPFGKLEYEDDEEKNRFVVRERYYIDDYWRISKESLGFDLYASVIRDYSFTPKTIGREGPLGLAYPLNINHEVVLHFPELINFDVGDDAFITLEDDAVRYSREVSSLNNALHIKHQYSAKKDHVEDSAVRSHNKLLADIRSNLSYNGWIGGSPDAATKAISSLVKYLDEGK